MRISDWSSDVCSSDLPAPDDHQCDHQCNPTVPDQRRTKECKRCECGQRDHDHLRYEAGTFVIASQRDNRCGKRGREKRTQRSEEHTSELQSLMRNSYAVFCLKKNKTLQNHTKTEYT